MTYRTPEQDERLTQLHKEWERVSDFGEAHHCDVSERLTDIEEEIESLTTALDKPACACFEFVGDNPNCPVHGDPRTKAEKALDEWQADAKATQEDAWTIGNAVIFGSKEWFEDQPEVEF